MSFAGQFLAHCVNVVGKTRFLKFSNAKFHESIACVYSLLNFQTHSNQFDKLVFLLYNMNIDLCHNNVHKNSKLMNYSQLNTISEANNTIVSVNNTDAKVLNTQKKGGFTWEYLNNYI